MFGFSYNGIHSSSYNVEYIPGPEDRWFNSPDFDTYSTDISWRNGGYYYGNSVKIREFKLNCWFSQITIRQRENIREWLRRDSYGQLIFDGMPFVYWNVRPTKVVTGKLYNDNLDTDGSLVYSGTLTITFQAIDPFGYLTRKYNTGSEHDNVNDYCNMRNYWTREGSSYRDVFVYNAGTERCGLSIVIGGTDDRTIRVLNNLNRSQCVLNSLPPWGSTAQSVLDINGDTGMVTVRLRNADTGDNGFAYHDRGMVTLEPGENHIFIQEHIPSSGNWIVPQHLSLEVFDLDFKPRIL